jgi:outer membrane protein assembly factor BamB
MNGFSRASNGTLDYTAPIVDVTGPTPESGGAGLLPVPWLTTDDPTDHLAIAVFNTDGPPCGNGGAVQLASFTASSKGALTSTNTGGNMPTVPGGASSMVLNPAGTVLAVATSTGVQFFHFNGAKPITEFTGIIGTSGFITAMAWDKDNHLYAINGATGRLHVYEATTTSVKEVSGSPYDDVCGADSCTLIVRIP